jgi:2,3-bisphosphoglycerate-dependent phosphoglycerate mutase
MAKLLRVGDQSYGSACGPVVQGLFATITYRLEPNGRGSRFPLIMNRLYGGRLDPRDVPAALRELDEIEAGLNRLAPERVVWSFTDLRRLDDRGFPVNRGASNVSDYFVSTDGRPLLTSVREAVLRARDRQEPVELASIEAVQRTRGAQAAMVLGFAWTIVGYLFFRNWILTSVYDSESKDGPLIWPLGLLMLGAGIVGMTVDRRPAVREWFQHRVWLSVGLLLAGMGLYGWLTWRS